MPQATIEFEDVLTKQLVDDWAHDRGFVAVEEICLHLEERFEVERIVIHNADDQGDFLLLKISTDQWADQREFALMSTGSLAW